MTGEGSSRTVTEGGDAPHAGREASTRIAGIANVVNPFRVHVLSLAIAFVFLVWVNRHQWFDLDEWAFIVGRGIAGSSREGLFEPHNEHWATIPILIWRALFTAFGVRTYTPYIVSLLLLHLVTVHLLWRVMLRVEVDAWTATLVCMPFLVLGAGWENLLSAFQFGFLAPLPLGLLALLVLPTEGRFGRRDVLVVGLLVVALMCQGTAVSVIFVVGCYALLARGVRLAVEIVAVPALVAAVWFAIWGRDVGATPSEPLTTALQKLPGAVWHGVVVAVDNATGLNGIGPVLLVLLALFLARYARPRETRWMLVLAMAAGAFVFLGFAVLRRTAVGPEAATGTRYGYMVLALLLPAAALAIDQLLGNVAARVPIIAVITVILLVVQVSELNRNAEQWAAIEQEQKHRILAAAQLIREGGPLLSPLPAPEYVPDLTVDALARLDREGQLPGNVRVTDEDRLTALAYLQVTLTDEPELSTTSNPPAVVGVAGASVAPVSGAATCIDVTPRSLGPVVSLRLAGPGSFEVRPSSSGGLGVQLRADDATGRLRAFSVVGGGSYWLNLNVSDGRADLVLPAQGITTLCGLAPLDEHFLVPAAEGSAAGTG